MKKNLLIAAVVSMLAAGCASVKSMTSQSDRIKQVTEAEIAFAKTMADRDHAAFMDFVADDAVFLNGGKPLRGKAAVGAHWQQFYAGPDAPFTWKPELVEVIGSGNLAQSIGPVMAPDGKIIARFYSTWRLEQDGKWRVVLDDGYDVCNCPAK